MENVTKSDVTGPFGVTNVMADAVAVNELQLASFIGVLNEFNAKEIMGLATAIRFAVSGFVTTTKAGKVE